MSKTILITKRLFTILLGLVLLLAGMGHLAWNKTEFLAQVPSWVPMDPALVVLLSGVLEIVLGVCLIFLKKYEVKVGIVTALFFVLIFPGNISQYMNGTDAFGLNTDTSRAVRLAFQPLLVIWALWATNAWVFFKNKE